MDRDKLVTELLHQIGKLMLAGGEEWRLQHAELMDAYQAVLDEYCPEVI